MLFERLGQNVDIRLNLARTKLSPPSKLIGSYSSLEIIKDTERPLIVPRVMGLVLDTFYL